ncbi:hypothetical protein Tco_1543750, partial [Tanacetum coccineum]
WVVIGDDDDDVNESSDDDEDNDVDVEEDEDYEEGEEHLAPANSTAVAFLAVEHAPSAKETKPFETDESATTPPPHHGYRVTARISIRDEPPTPFWSDIEVARLRAIHTPPPSPSSSCSSLLPQIPSPPLPSILSPLPVSSSLPVSPPLPLAPPPLPVNPTYPLGYRAAMIRLRAKALSTSHLPPPHIILSHTTVDTPPSGTPPLLPILLPTSSPPLHLLSIDHRADRPEVTLPPQKRLGIALGPSYKVGESSSAGSRERCRRMTEFATRVRQDTNEIYVRLDDEQTKRQLMAGRLNMLYRDRHTHARTALLMEREARMSREAWG